MSEKKVEKIQKLLDTAHVYSEYAATTTGGYKARGAYGNVAAGCALTAIAQMMFDERTMPREIGVVSPASFGFPE